MAGVEWRGGEKMQTTVIEEQQQQQVKKKRLTSETSEFELITTARE